MKNKKTINIIIILICIFLCVCAVCIYVIIPKCLVRIANEKTFLNKDNCESTYGDVFYAKIEKIEITEKTNYDGILSHGTMYVNGLDLNDVNHRGKRNFSIDDDIKFYWKHKEIELSDLKVGQTVAITSIGTIYEGGTGYLTKVARVTLLDDEL